MSLSFKRLDKMASTVAAAVRKHLGHKQPVVIYSAYDQDRLGRTLDNLAKPLRDTNGKLVEGPVVFTAPYDAFYDGEHSRGGKKGSSYRSSVVHNPTFLDAALAADCAIRTTQDRHHVFLEGAVRKGRCKKTRATLIELSFGS